MSKRNIFLVVCGLASVMAIVSIVFLAARPEFRSILFPRAVLPTITFLGEGPEATFEAGAGEFLILKLFPQAELETVPGPASYTLEEKERAWLCVGECEGFLLQWDAEVNFGQVHGGGEVLYIGIDDDVDDRINTWYLDGEPIHTIEQGMVFSGSFEVPHDGELVLMAVDSIAAHIDVPVMPTATPTPPSFLTPTATSSPTSTPTPGTPTQTPTETPVFTSTPTVPTKTPMPTSTPTSGPSPTGTQTPVPTNTPTPGPEPTSTPTDVPGTPAANTPTPTETPFEAYQLIEPGYSLPLVLTTLGGIVLVLLGLIL